MDLNYTVDYNKMPKVIYCDGVENLILNEFQGVFKAALYIFREIFKIDSLEVDFDYQDTCYNLILSIILSIKTKVGKFNLVLDDHKFRIYNSDGSWLFKIEYFYPSDELRLAEYVKYQKDRILVERFFTHKIEIEEHFTNTGKVFYLAIPIGTPAFVDLRYLATLKENSDINTIIKFYRKMFLPEQGEYDKNNCNTALRTFQKTNDFADYTNKGIKLDEVYLKKGIMLHYQLGHIYFDNENNFIIVLLNDGTYTISGYKSTASALDINETIFSLERRKQELH